jgi:tetratricopeptide (TPR) repeat protein
MILKLTNLPDRIVKSAPMKMQSLKSLILLTTALLGFGQLPLLATPPGTGIALPPRDFDYPVVAPIDPNRFPPNPLGILTSDPLLMDPNKVLSPLEKDQLRSALENLHQEGQQQFAQKKSDEAFLTWFRELRLRQALGFREEIFALAKVGETAWQNNRTRDLRDITERLQSIQTQIQSDSQSTTELNEYLALAYQVVRSPQLALSIHEPRLVKLRTNAASQSPIEIFNTLNSMGQIHLDWFRYGKAQQTYQDLRELSRLAQDRTSEALYLIQLTYIAEQRRQPQDAIVPLQDLIQLYATQPEVQPALYLRLAQNYAAAQDWPNAERTYQATFNLSQSLSQNSYGSTALFELADAYKRTDRFKDAEQVYDYLVDAEQGVYNLHNAMKASDYLGQMRDRQQNYSGAIVAYEQAKALAQRLALKPDELQVLQQRLDSTRKKITPQPTTPNPISPNSSMKKG